MMSETFSESVTCRGAHLQTWDCDACDWRPCRCFACLGLCNLQKEGSSSGTATFDDCVLNPALCMPLWACLGESPPTFPLGCNAFLQSMIILGKRGPPPPPKGFRFEGQYLQHAHVHHFEHAPRPHKQHQHQGVKPEYIPHQFTKFTF